MSDFFAIVRRMADAIEAATPRIVDMWASFPYAELDGDDEVMTELRASARAWREYEREAMTVPPAGAPDEH